MLWLPSPPINKQTDKNKYQDLKTTDQNIINHGIVFHFTKTFMSNLVIPQFDIILFDMLKFPFILSKPVP